ncbi:MAG: hypothetical protein ACRCXX_06165 [Cetobacterium sp.]|uniref:hypothetical protein n=1 Tax=Cetobacterium sp. TaxID=2071632 RepID=UPI003F2A9437
MDNKMLMSDSYVKLLTKFAADSEVFELIDECIKDELREREKYFLATGKYPDVRNGLMKLKMDINQRATLFKEGK